MAIQCAGDIKQRIASAADGGVTIAVADTGIGMTDEYDIGFFMKRARAARETFGDLAFHGDRAATLMGY